VSRAVDGDGKRDALFWKFGVLRLRHLVFVAAALEC